MLKIRLLGETEIRLNNELIEVSSRPVQSLFSYLLLNAGIFHRREKLAGILWPESTETNARNNLRHALWRLRKALRNAEEKYILADDIAIAFDAGAAYWLDTIQLARELEEWTADDLLENLMVYRGELLPGFYDEWVVLERERMQAIFERKMKLLLEQMGEEQRWLEVLTLGEKWIAFGHTPEPAYRALIVAHAALGDQSSAAAVYQRCIKDLREELGVVPSIQTQTLFEDISRGEYPQPITMPDLSEALKIPASDRVPYKGLHYFDQADADLFFGRELLTAKLVSHLRPALTGTSVQEMGHFLAVIGASGCGKSSIIRAGLLAVLSQGETLADGTLPPPGSSDMLVHVLTPTAHPLEALAITLTRKSKSIRITTLATRVRKRHKPKGAFPPSRRSI
jgi:DNA-binding SARP family transcriptional activator